MEKLSLLNGDKFIVTGCLYGNRVDRSYQGDLYEVVHISEEDLPFILVKAVYERFRGVYPGKVFALNIREWELKKPSEEYVNALMCAREDEEKKGIH